MLVLLILPCCKSCVSTNDNCVADLERVGVTLSLDLKNSVTRERVMPAEGVANMIVSDMEKSLDLLDNN